MQKSSIILILIFFLSGIFYYLYTDSLEISGNSVKEITATVSRVIDGDTIEIETGERIRLLGINTPEKKTFFYNESFNFTKQLENKTVRIEILEKDKYGRFLGYVFYNKKMFNEEILKNGFAHTYFYGRDKYTNLLEKAELIAKEQEIGIWKKSSNHGCIVLIELKYKEDGKRCTNKEMLTLKNFCAPIDSYIKDDATHDYFVTIPSGIFTKNFSCIFNDAGDSLFIWDEEGLLLFERYP